MRDKKKHINLYRTFSRDRHTKTMGVLIALAAVVALWQEVSWIIPADVRVHYVAMDGKSRTVALETRSDDVEGVLEEAGIRPTDIDTVSPCREYPVKNGMKVTVTESIRTTAEIGGKEQEIVLVNGTVRENLKRNKIHYDSNDIVRPALGRKVESDTHIVLDRVETRKTERTETVKAKNKVILDPVVTSGTITETSGQDGKAVCRLTTTYVNGKKAGTKKQRVRWITKPKDHVMHFGTSKTGESGEMSYSKTFTANTTAYYSGSDAHGATGQRVHYGTCAVDPSVIPYGTKLYIEGYGFAVANDCGGAVKGHIIDLYMNSTAECIQWGRQNRTAYILE